VSDGPRLWGSDSWREEATAWLDERLAATGRSRTGPVEQPHLRPWGTVLTAPTGDGPVWLKVPGPTTAFEVALYDLVRRVDPERILEPLAVDADRGWVLLPDGGRLLGDTVAGAELAEAMVGVLPEYGALQRNLLPHADALLAAGVADMRAPVMPGRFDEAVEAVGRRVETGEDRAVLARAQGMRATFAGWCDELAGAVVGPSIDHNDLHPWNVFVGAGHDRPRFYDWGDAVVAHPFSSMLLGLGMIGMQLEVGPDDPAVVKARDAYLEVWSDLADRAALVAELELACWVGRVARALTWERSLRDQSTEEAGEFADGPLRALEALTSRTWLVAI
jgi:hypothetical protein